MSTSPTSRSLRLLRREGWTPSVVERWLPYARVRSDCLGFADVLAVREDVAGVLFIQACAGGDASKRVRKLLGVQAVRVALLAGNQVEVWAWRKSAKTNRWSCRRQPIALAMLPTLASNEAGASEASPESEPNAGLLLGHPGAS
jgi:hypothetical protein